MPSLLIKNQDDDKHTCNHIPFVKKFSQRFTRKILDCWPWQAANHRMRAFDTTKPVRVGAGSVTGNYRQVNEDSFYVNTDEGLFLVADGMGGHRGGAEASRIVARRIPKKLNAMLATDVDPHTFEVAVRAAVQSSRDEMKAFAEQHPDFCSMGSTLALACLAHGTLHVTHIGDSRVYLLRSGRIRRLTSDHSFVQAFIDAGAMTEEEAQRSPYRHQILNYIGVKLLDQQPVVSSVDLMPGDRILLATDGLTDVLDDETLHQIVMSHTSPQAAADALISAALRMDSKDNISCVVVELPTADEEKTTRQDYTTAPMAA